MHPKLKESHIWLATHLDARATGYVAPFLLKYVVCENGVYSLKWRLNDRYLRWGTLADPRPGRGHGDQCNSSEFLQELRISGFTRF